MKKLNFQQAIMTALTVATVLTIADSIVDWSNRIYSGIFAFIVTLLTGFLAQKIIKD